MSLVIMPTKKIYLELFTFLVKKLSTVRSESQSKNIIQIVIQID